MSEGCPWAEGWGKSTKGAGGEEGTLVTGGRHRSPTRSPLCSTDGSGAGNQREIT